MCCFVSGPEEARLLREATQGMGGGRAPIGSSSGMSPMPGPSFPQPGIGSSVGRPSQGTPGSAVPGLFPGLESQPGQLDPFRSTGTGTSPTFPGSGPMRPGFQGTGTSPTFPGSGPMRPGFQGSSPVQPGFQGSSPVQPGFQGSSPVRPGFQGSSPMQPGIQGSMRPGFQGSMRPGFQGSDPSSPMFPGAPSFPGSSPSFPGSSPSFPGSSPSFAGSSPSFPGSSQSLPGSTNPFNPEVRPGGGPPTGMSDSGLMGARPLGTPPSFPGSFAGGPGVGMAGSATGVDTFIPGRSTSSAGVPAGAGDGDPRAIGEASLIMSDSRGHYYNFFAYTGSTPIRVAITKSGFCQPPVRTPTGGPPRCEQECNSDSECTPRGAAQKCCPVGLCSLGCVDPRTGTPGS